MLEEKNGIKFGIRKLSERGIIEPSGEKSVSSNNMSFRILGPFFNLIFHENNCDSEEKLHLISDETYVFILQYSDGKWF